MLIGGGLDITQRIFVATPMHAALLRMFHLDILLIEAKLTRL
jgi:hypothetical protein